MIQLVVASTLYGAVTATAAIVEGMLGEPARRDLIMANTTAVPELAPTLSELPGFEALAGSFGQTISYNRTIAPFHPSLWKPHADEAGLIGQHLRDRWHIGNEAVELVLESIQVPPAQALAEIFGASRIRVYADGLMSYGPTRNRLGQFLGARIREVVHPDLLPGLRPVLLREFDTPTRPLPVAALRHVLDAITASVDLSSLPSSEGGHVLVLGQYLSALGVLPQPAEQDLHRRMITAAVAAGSEEVWFKAHPSAPAAMSDELAAWAAEVNIELRLLPATIPAEAVFAHAPPRYVVGCFSTALMTAVSLYEIPAATVGTDLLLRSLRPFENSNRVPVTIVAAVLPDLERTASPPGLPDLAPGHIASELQPLVDTVAFCMQPAILGEQWPRAEHWLATHADGPSLRYFDRARLTALGLPGGKFVPGLRRLDHANRLRVRRSIGQSRKVIKQARHSLKKIVRP